MSPVPLLQQDSVGAPRNLPTIRSPHDISETLSRQDPGLRGGEGVAGHQKRPKAAGSEQGQEGFLCDLMLNEHLVRKKRQFGTCSW